MTRSSSQRARAAATPLAAQPKLNQRGRILQPFGTLVDYQIGLSEESRKASVERLNDILASSMYLRDMYKKAHWQVSGHTFYQLHLLYQAHYEQQAAIVDLVAERVQTLGGVSVAVPEEAASRAKIERPPSGREQVPEQISRLIEAHGVILARAREAARIADRNDDLGTNDLLLADVIRPNEKQVWFLSEHLVDAPLVNAT